MNIIPEMRLEHYIGYLCLYYYHMIYTSDHMIYTTDGGLLVLECIIRLVVSVLYHRIYTTDGGLLVLECIIRPVVCVSITGSIPLMVDY